MRLPIVRVPGLPPIQVSGGTLLSVILLAVIVHPSLVTSGIAEGSAAVLLAVAVGLSVIVSVFLHELAHALLARAFGGDVELIALTLWGGHTQYRAGTIGPWASTAISLAGPATNALIALGAHLAQPALAGSPPAAAIAQYGVILNIGLAVFNLLPGLPMDGGRAVESILGAVTGRRILATVVTAWIGFAIAATVVVLPLLRVLRGGLGVDVFLLLWAVILAATLWQGAISALRGARVERRVERLDPARLARPVHLAPAALPVGRLDVAPDALAGVVVLDESRRAYRVDASALEAVPDERRDEVPLGAVSRPLGESVAIPDHATGAELVRAALETGSAVVLLVDDRGHATGVVTRDDLAAHLR